jgi:hypothetical protein
MLYNTNILDIDVYNHTCIYIYNIYILLDNIEMAIYDLPEIK